MFGGEGYVCLAPESVRSEISAHKLPKRFLLSAHDFPVALVDAVRRDRPANGRKGINARPSAYDRARVQNAVATDFDIIAEHRAHLYKARFIFLFALYDHFALVRFYIGSYRAGAHVSLVAENTVAHVIEMGHLHAVE